MTRQKIILVSRNLKASSALRAWCDQQEHALIEVPFIRIDPIKDVDIPTTDWIFFSSPNGLDIYFENYPLIAKKIGVYGKGTASRLELMDIEADFVGNTSKDPTEIGKEFFAQVHENESVLFPQSQLSKESIIGANPDRTCYQRVIYNTSIEGQEVPQVDVAILTSPSNIDGFLLENKTGNTKFIVLGKTSRSHFEGLNRTTEIYPAETASEESVIQLLEQLLQDQK